MQYESYYRRNNVEQYQNTCSEWLFCRYQQITTDEVNEDYSYYPYMIKDVEWWENSEDKFSEANKDVLENFEWEWLHD